MQMKRFISIILSAALLIPIISIAASAYESSYSGEESDKTLKGTIKFDGGDGWDNKTVLFYIWDSTTKERATKDGWVYEDCWGSAKKIGGTLVDGETTVYESYEFDLSGREDHDVFVIFHNRDTGAQTRDCAIDNTVFGKTARRNGVIYESPSDSEKTAEGVVFDDSAPEPQPEPYPEPEPTTAKGTFMFDGGKGWENKIVCFYIWDDTAREWATKDGWVNEDYWGSAKRLAGTLVDGETTVYESYEFDLSGREDHDVFVIFHNRDTGEQTMNCLINETVFGKTARRSGVMYENPVDSEKTAEGVEFDGATGVGIEKMITSSGKIQGDIIAPGKTPDGIVAQFVLDNMGKVEKTSGKLIVTNESVKNAIDAFGTNSDAVWAKYQTFSGSETYNAEEAEKVIMGTGAEPEPEPKPEPKVKILGDVDHDTRITSADSLYILRRSVQLEPEDADLDKLCDVNGDGSIKSDDALEVLRASVQIPSSYPIGQAVS